MKHIYTIVGVLLSVTMAYAQYGETIRTGRPCQSIGAFSVGKGILQFQQGIDYIRSTEERYSPFLSPDGRIIKYTDERIYSNNVIRYGITRKVELSAVIDYSLDTRTEEGELITTEPVEDNNIRAFDIGGRLNLLEGKNNGPVWCIQARLGFADYVQRAEQPDSRVDLKIRTALVQPINNVQSFTLNLATNTFDDLSYTLNYALNITPKFGWVVENYGSYVFDFKGDQKFQTYYDTGFWYLLNSNVQLDVQGGFGSNDLIDSLEPTRSFFIGAGISWRLNCNG